MKKLLFIVVFITTVTTLQAQLRLDVDGNAHISGRIAIGTDDPFARLHIVNGSDASLAGSGYAIFGGRNSTNLTLDNNEIIAKINGNDAGTLFLQRFGGKIAIGSFAETQVGIGTDSPLAPLHVDGNAIIMGRLDLNSIGAANLYIGTNAGINAGPNVTSNTYIGDSAGEKNETGVQNTYVGSSTGRSHSSGDHNTFIGAFAGEHNRGNDNTFIGRSTGSTLRGGDSNILIGNSADGTISGLSQAMAIGYNAKVACDNCAVIGGTGVDAMKVGIGTTTPTADLYIKQSSGTFSKPGTGGIILQDSSNASYKWQIGAVSQTLAFIYNGALKSYIDVTGHYNVVSSFTSPQDDGGSRNNSIQSMQNVLDKVKRLQPKTKQVANGRNKKTMWGFAAEEVAPLFPEITPEVDGQRGIIYDYFGILSIKAIQELAATVDKVDKDLQKENERQSQQIMAQQQQINTQKSQINELKSLVEKLLTQNAETSKSTSYVLPLEQQSFLAQNQPNPFRENTLVDYFIPATVKNAYIQVTNVDGKILGQVTISETGKGQVTIQSKSYPAGTYFYSLVLDGQVMETKRMVLAR